MRLEAIQTGGGNRKDHLDLVKEEHKTPTYDDWRKFEENASRG